MTKKSLSLIDINTADAATLTQLHGVGSALAERIIAARPFASVSDLRRVSGVGPAFLERVRPQIVLSEPSGLGGEDVPVEAAPSTESEEALLEADSPPPPAETTPPPTGPTLPKAQEETALPPPEAEPDGPAEPKAALPKVDPAPPPPAELEATPARVKTPPDQPAMPAAMVADQPAATVADQPAATVADKPAVIVADKLAATVADKPARKKEPALVTRAQALWITLAAGTLVFVLAVALSLSVITAINGGLEFANPSQVAELSDRLDGLDRQAGVLEQDLEGMRKRLDNLDTLSGRLEAVEETALQLQAGADEVNVQVDALTTQVDEFEGRLDDLEGDVANLVADYDIVKEQNTRFQDFLDGLRTLLGDLFESEVTQ